MGNETKKTMRFWIFSGVVAILASQLPLIMKKGQQGDNQTQAQQQECNQTQQKKKLSWWKKLIIGAVVFRIIYWLIDYFN